MAGTTTDAHETWTTRRLLAWITRHLEVRGVDPPRLVAEVLLAEVLDCERIRLYMEVDRPATGEERARLRDLVSRAAAHEPVQYLVGRWPFFGREFDVDRSTLIPRPATETLVELALGHARRTGAARAADIGTGTGCIAVSLAVHLPEIRVLATDIVPEALRLAERNARRHGVADRVDFALGRTWTPIDAAGGGPLDLICANPPYVPDDEWHDLEPNVRDFEPETALRGGPDGLSVIRPIVQGAPKRLRPGGTLVVEIPCARRDEVIAIAEAAPGLGTPEVRQDTDGLWRVLVAHAE